MGLCYSSLGHKGICCFVVEKDWEGFSIGKHEETMGVRASGTCPLAFEGVKIPKENLVGKEGEGFKVAMATLDCGRIGIAAQAVGIAQRALDEAINYAREAGSVVELASRSHCITMILLSVGRTKKRKLCSHTRL